MSYKPYKPPAHTDAQHTLELISPAQPQTVQRQSTQQDAAQTLLKHPNLWRAGQLRQHATQHTTPSEFAELDTHLPGGGWPGAGLMELLLSSAGIGELRLLVPALKCLAQQSRWIAWINPPFVPYAPALQAAGIDIEKILLIHPRAHQDTLWAIERALKSGTCSTVLAWPDERKLKLKDTQRLQLAAKQGNTLGCLFRPQSAHTQSSMAELRLALRSQTPGNIGVDILKRRGGWPVQQLVLPVAELTQSKHREPADIQQQLALWRGLRERPLSATPTVTEPSEPDHSNDNFAEHFVPLKPAQPSSEVQVH